ncbi:TlpA family protein disulfide reductase [Campylobacter peloridis]|uniref:TlpA family protein disulfide reductase n=1 Tax=Campylobacter peloridis TaxID=488546 RepID=A0A5C7DXJ9_9BACT|nr:TlpA disulfide reductase family protein [Campylobacter peloridis]TXE81302.1 TlpA family protein disulfide reductase [Campylobacter peloridis]
MKIKILITSLIIFIFFNACSNEKENTHDGGNNQASLSQSENINFTLKFLDGRKLFIKTNNQNFYFDDTSKAKLFVFFTTWCAPCKVEIPHLNNLYQKYKDRFEVIALSLEENKEQEMFEFIQEYKIAYPVAIGENNFVFSKILNVGAIPTMVLFNAKGEKVKEYLGVIPEEMLDVDIQKAIL